MRIARPLVVVAVGVLGTVGQYAAFAADKPAPPEPPPIAAGAAKDDKDGARPPAPAVTPAPGAPPSAPGPGAEGLTGKPAEGAKPGATNVPGGTGAPGADEQGSRGIVIRFDAGAQKVDTPVVVHMKPDDGPVCDIQLKDDGAPPDVNQGDGTWSGTLWNTHDEFSVTLSTGKTNVDGGKISWSKDELQRDLSLTLLDGHLKAEAAVASSSAVGTPPTPPGEGGSSGGGGGGSAGGGSPQGTPTPAGASGFQLDGKSSSGGGSSASPPPGGAKSTDSTLYVAIGAVGLLLAGMVGLYRMGGRGRASADGLPAGMTVVPEAGLLGPDTPSLSEGLSQWVVAPNDAHELLRPLLATLARYHRVVVCAPARSALPPVPGGPVYRVAPGKPGDLADAVEALQDMSAGGIAVLMLGDGLDGATLKAHGDALPEGVGGAVVVMQVLMATLPVVHCARRGDAWHLKFTSSEIDVAARVGGFERLG